METYKGILSWKMTSFKKTREMVADLITMSLQSKPNVKIVLVILRRVIYITHAE
jgi:hypothetical protein